MFRHDYPRQLTPGERMTVALFHFEGRFSAMDLADFVGISNHEARKKLHALEYLGVVAIVDETGPVYRRADLVSDSAGEDDGCDWCGSNSESNWVVQSQTPAGEYIGLDSWETVDLCDDCMAGVSKTTSYETTQTKSGQDVLPIHPICQAEDCNQIAGRTIFSRRGHPDDEWKLCPGHYSEVEGIDPYYPLGHEWTLRKLQYRCPQGVEISYGKLLPNEEQDGISCTCGYRHTPADIDR